MPKKKRLKVGMLVQVINRHTSEVMPQVYVLIEGLGEQLWETSPVSDMSRVKYFHTKQLKEVVCE